MGWGGEGGASGGVGKMAKVSKVGRKMATHLPSTGLKMAKMAT